MTTINKSLVTSLVKLIHLTGRMDHAERAVSLIKQAQPELRHEAEASLKFLQDHFQAINRAYEGTLQHIYEKPQHHSPRPK